MSNIKDHLDIKKGLTAVIGSGGKTTLINHLAAEPDGTVIVTTSTHIYPPEGMEIYTGDSAEELKKLLAEKRVVCAGRADGPKLTSPDISFEDMKQLADYVLTEADGSKGLPLKAHEDFEPVIPECTDCIILMVGASGFGRPAAESIHRYERFADVMGAGLAESGGTVTPEMYAEFAASEMDDYAARHIETGADMTILINQSDDEKKFEDAKRFAEAFRRYSKYPEGTQIFAVSLHSDNYVML